MAAARVAALPLLLVLLLALALPALSPPRTVTRETERRRMIPRQCDSYAFPSRGGGVGLFLVLVRPSADIICRLRRGGVLPRCVLAGSAGGGGGEPPRCCSWCCSAARILAPFPLSFQITVLLYGGSNDPGFSRPHEVDSR